MSLFWDPINRRPQVWVYLFFTVITVLLCVGVYCYGNYRADRMGVTETKPVEVFK